MSFRLLPFYPSPSKRKRALRHSAPLAHALMAVEKPQDAAGRTWQPCTRLKGA